MNGKTIFGLMVCIMAGQPLQGCCSRAGEGATTSLVVGEERIADGSEEIRSEDGLAWMEVDTLHDSIGINVPPVSETNVPPSAERNVPLVSD